MVDTNGAGDSFAAGYILAAAAGHPVPAAVANWAGERREGLGLVAVHKAEAPHRAHGEAQPEQASPAPAPALMHWPATRPRL